MSIHDESKDLESRLRLIRPQTKPLPPAFKRQLRQELMEQMTMNNNIFSFRTLGVALGGLILILGIPLLFWLSQMSIETANPPSVTPDLSQELDSASQETWQTISMSEINGAIDFAAPTEDKVWLVSPSISQGKTVSRYDTLDLTLAYDLISAEEAKLVVQLLDGPRSVLTVEKTVYGIGGEVEFALPLTQLEAIAGERVNLTLSIRLQDINPGATIFDLQMDRGWTVDLIADPPITKAEIISIGHPFDDFHINGVAWGKDEMGRPLLRVDMRYRISGQSTADINLKVTTFDQTVEFATGSASVHPGYGWIFLVLPFDQPLLTDEPLLNLSAELTVEDRKLHHVKPVLIEGADLLPLEGGDDRVWIIATDTHTETGAEARTGITIIVGYNLSSDYSSGHIDFYQFDSLYSGDNMPPLYGTDVSPGSGIVKFYFGYSMTAQEVRDRSTVTLKLFGTTGDGTEVLVAETSQWDWKNEATR